MADEDAATFKLLAEYSADVLCRAGLDRKITYMSPSCFAVLGWLPEEMEGRPVADFLLPEELPLLIAHAALAASSDAKVEPLTLRMLKKDNSYLWTEGNASLVRDPITQEPREFVVVIRDITDRKLLEDKLAALSLTDGLTGLANRRAFDEALQHEWRRTLREGSQTSLLLLDLDHFKRFNDQYGHQVGDDCLRAVSAAVKATVRTTDMAARYGGEEIAVILPSSDSSGAIAIAEKIRGAIEALKISHEGNPGGGGWVTASVGVATALARYGGTMRMPESLLLAADNALYKAKHQGRNCIATALLMAPAGIEQRGNP
jgi:diguanylate cyclase (GGDEF)-like protein/PAS domain S-box-containing protein